jgi:hypothetical protein
LYFSDILLIFTTCFPSTTPIPLLLPCYNTSLIFRLISAYSVKEAFSHNLAAILSLSIITPYSNSYLHPTPQYSAPHLLHSETKLRGFSPQANYTDRATAACRRRWGQLLRIEGVAWSAQQIPTAVNLHFLNPEPLYFHSSCFSVLLTRLSEHRSRPTTSQKIWQRRESNPGSSDL